MIVYASVLNFWVIKILHVCCLNVLKVNWDEFSVSIEFHSIRLDGPAHEIVTFRCTQNSARSMWVVRMYGVFEVQEV